MLNLPRISEGLELSGYYSVILSVYHRITVRCTRVVGELKAPGSTFKPCRCLESDCYFDSSIPFASEKPRRPDLQSKIEPLLKGRLIRILWKKDICHNPGGSKSTGLIAGFKARLEKGRMSCFFFFRLLYMPVCCSVLLLTTWLRSFTDTFTDSFQ